MVKKRKLGEAFLYGFLALFSLLVLAPFLFTVIHSLMPPEQVQNAYGDLGSKTVDGIKLPGCGDHRQHHAHIHSRLLHVLEQPGGGAVGMGLGVAALSQHGDGFDC